MNGNHQHYVGQGQDDRRWHPEVVLRKLRQRIQVQILDAELAAVGAGSGSFFGDAESGQNIARNITPSILVIKTTPLLERAGELKLKAVFFTHFCFNFSQFFIKGVFIFSCLPSNPNKHENEYHVYTIQEFPTWYT